MEKNDPLTRAVEVQALAADNTLGDHHERSDLGSIKAGLEDTTRVELDTSIQEATEVAALLAG